MPHVKQTTASIRINIALITSPSVKKLVVIRKGMSCAEVLSIAKAKLQRKKLCAIHDSSKTVLCDSDLHEISNNVTLLFSEGKVVDNEETFVSDVVLTEQLESSSIDSDDDGLSVISGDDADWEMQSIASSNNATAASSDINWKPRSMPNFNDSDNMSIYTADIALDFTLHGWKRAVNRRISLEKLKTVIKHGICEEDEDTMCLKYSYNGLTCITDKTSTKIITCYGNILDSDDINDPRIKIEDQEMEVVRQSPIATKIVGEQGEMIRGIQNETGCTSIQVIQPENYISVIGRELAIQWALVYINDILDSDGDMADLKILHRHTNRIPITNPKNDTPSIENMKKRYGIHSFFVDFAKSQYVIKGSQGAVRVASKHFEQSLTFKVFDDRINTSRSNNKPYWNAKDYRTIRDPPKVHNQKLPPPPPPPPEKAVKGKSSKVKPPKDKLIICKNCEQGFFFTVAEQEEFSRPDHCSECRLVKSIAWLYR